MANSIDNTEEIIDSREVIERIEELVAEFVDATEAEDDPDDGVMTAEDWAHGLTEDDANELAALINFRDAADEVSDWECGATFIHNDYFEDYAREFVIDCGYVPADLPGWVAIDWEETADNVRNDYTSYEFDDVTYWARA